MNICDRVEEDLSDGFRDLVNKEFRRIGRKNFAELALKGLPSSIGNRFLYAVSENQVRGMLTGFADSDSLGIMWVYAVGRNKRDTVRLLVRTAISRWGAPGKMSNCPADTLSNELMGGHYVADSLAAFGLQTRSETLWGIRPAEFQDDLSLTSDVSVHTIDGELVPFPPSVKSGGDMLLWGSNRTHGLAVYRSEDTIGWFSHTDTGFIWQIEVVEPADYELVVRCAVVHMFREGDSHVETYGGGNPQDTVLSRLGFRPEMTGTVYYGPLSHGAIRTLWGDSDPT